MALEGEVVDGEDRLRTRSAVVMEIDRRQRGLPIVGVNDVGRVAGDRAFGEVGADPRQRGETMGVVAPVAPVRAEIGIADAIEEMRRVEHEHVEAGGAAGEHPRRPAEQLGVGVDRLGGFELGQHRRIAGQQGADGDVLARQRRRQRAGDVGEAAGLDQRIDLGSDRKDGERGHFAILSSIGWVISVTPPSVRRNRLASSTGSSPTTSPSGMTTPESITAFLIRAPRPICA